MIEGLVTFKEVSNRNQVFDRVVNVACLILGIVICPQNPKRCATRLRRCVGSRLDQYIRITLADSGWGPGNFIEE